MAQPRCYDMAQTFYIDSKAVSNSPTVEVDKIRLFFRSRPRAGNQKTQNKSGIANPGVTVILCGTKDNGKPKIRERYATARLEYDEINVSKDASNPTKVVFDKNVILKTDEKYCIAIIADGHEDFEMWTNKKGDKKVRQNTKSTGTTDKSVLNLYTMLDRDGLTNNLTGKDDDASWVPLTDEDLKFKFLVKKFDTNSPVEVLDTSAVEFILYDRTQSKGEKNLKMGRLVYQNTSFHSGTVNITKGEKTITGTGVNFQDLYGSISNAYIVIVSEETPNSYLTAVDDNFTINIRKILSIDSNTQLTIDRGPSTTNSAAKFLIPTAVGTVVFNSISTNFSRFQNIDSWYFPDRAKLDMIIINDSNANSSVRFVNNAIGGVTINNGGSGYSNSDILTVYSSTSGSLNCTANVITNSSGGITDFYISNTGWGMVAAPSYNISNSSVLGSNTSAGSGANLSFIEGPMIRSATEKFRMRDINVIDYQIDAIEPVFPVADDQEKEYKHFWHHAFYVDTNGAIQQLPVADSYNVSNYKRSKSPFKLDPIILSTSNLLAGISNGAYTNSQFTLSDGSTINATASVLIETKCKSTNPFASTKMPDQPDILYYRYVINNSYEGENTSSGNALAKHISKKITFAEGRLAEDIMVYISAYRPPGTDIKAFARIHNSQDPEAFDDKDWTLLDCVSGNSDFSVRDKKKDLIEYTYTFNQYPNSQYTSPGVVQIANTTTTNVIGTGTNFLSQVDGFSSGDLVKIYSPIFPNNYFISVVTEVTNATHLVVANNTANASLTGSGLYIDKIAYKHQAFRDIRFQNVVTYFSTSMQGYSGYDTVSVKLVLLSNTSSNVPEIDDVRIVGVSA